MVMARNRVDAGVRAPVVGNKVARLTEAFTLLVSDTRFHGRLVHCEGSERQNVSREGRAEELLEKEAQSRVRSQDRGMRRETDPEKIQRGAGKTAESSDSRGASMMNRRPSASSLPPHSVQHEIYSYMSFGKSPSFLE